MSSGNATTTSGRVLICSGESTLGAGDISVRVGQSCSGPGGTLEVRAGSSTSNTGGSVRVAGGSGCGGGNVTIEGGTSTQAQGGSVSMQSGVGMIKSGDVRITTPPGSDGPDDNDAQSHGNICLCTGDVNSGQSGACLLYTSDAADE